MYVTHPPPPLHERQPQLPPSPATMATFKPTHHRRLSLLATLFPFVSFQSATHKKADHLLHFRPEHPQASSLLFPAIHHLRCPPCKLRPTNVPPLPFVSCWKPPPAPTSTSQPPPHPAAARNFPRRWTPHHPKTTSPSSSFLRRPPLTMYHFRRLNPKDHPISATSQPGISLLPSLVVSFDPDRRAKQKPDPSSLLHRGTSSSRVRLVVLWQTSQARKRLLWSLICDAFFLDQFLARNGGP
jgi:hypothetical protein